MTLSAPWSRRGLLEIEIRSINHTNLKPIAASLRYFIWVPFFGFTLLQLSCTRTTFKNLNYCYRQSEVTRSATVRHDGYYKRTERFTIKDSLRDKTDTFERGIVFYSDGIILYSYFPDQFKGKNPIGYKGGMAQWGSYFITNDTIKAHIIDPPRINQPWAYVWFKILDGDRLIELCHKWDNPINNDDVVKVPSNTRLIASFSESATIPNPDFSWIKKKKWFWCDQGQYREWKRKTRREKREKRYS
jgi:hypothetical protein